MCASTSRGSRQRPSWRDLPLLRDRPIQRGELWILSAGFNVRRDLKETSRIDCELEDVRRISRAGGRVAILSHQGNFADGSALHLDFVAHYLSQRLGQPVRYISSAVGEAAVSAARAMREGDVAVFGNTRRYHGEERNDADLARAFSEIGDAVALGGFSKAHRAHASNVGILRFRSGYLAASVSTQIDQLSNWAGDRPDCFSMAVIGGRKPEKVEGLRGFSKIYDFIVPGGVVLNSILKVKGYDVGGSYLGENEKANLEAAGQVLREPRKAEIFVPSQVVVAAKAAPDARPGKVIDVRRGVDAGDAIVDFVLDGRVSAALDRVVKTRGRMIIAGTPALYPQGFGAACEPLLAAARALDDRAILLGGDTTADLPFDGNKSVGGGSALAYLCHGDLPILRALAERSSHAGTPS